MSYQTTSVFDALELDTTTQRLAARNALALAHIRVENHLGAFLSGSLTEEAFEARLASVKPEMDAYVAAACEECGHDKPEHITASLVDNYRVNRRWQPRVAYPQYPEPMGAQPAAQPIDPAIAQQGGDPGMQMPQGQPQAPMAQDTPDLLPWEHQNQQALQTQQFYPQPDPADPYAQQQMMGATNPSEQKSDSDKLVKCPECGGNGKTANKSECPKCHGKGEVANFGESSLDKLASVPEPRTRRWTPVVAAGNTDLGGPEPKIDKAKWTEANPGAPVLDSKEHPTKRHDILEPIIMTNRAEDDHELKEIGEQTTEHVDLPSGGVTDHGFYDGGETKGPHTKTFGDGKHADPVTHEKQ